MKEFRAYLSREKAALAVLALAGAVFGLVTALYGLPWEPFLYGMALLLAGAAVTLETGWRRYAAHCRAVREVLANLHNAAPALPEPLGGDHGLEAACQQAILALAADGDAQRAAAREDRSDLLDYFTLWVHQIKTPIAALRLLLQSQAGGGRAELEAELFKIEQYVEMVLSYLRLGEDASDLVLESAPLDPEIRSAVRRFAAPFLLKRLTLDYAPTGAAAVTDRKWLGFILEQLLSNAAKYTPPGGKVTIEADAQGITVADSGIGIRPEDLPRIFEKGYTGYNGREHRKSTGLGLYLCSQAAGRIGCTLHARSAPGAGTRMELRFPAQGGLYE